MAVDVQDSAEQHHGFALFLYAVVTERKKKMNMEINGITLQADFMDADFMEAFEPALHQMLDDINKSKAQTGRSVAAGYRELNQCVENFFDTVWGPDTGSRIFNGSGNVRVHMEAVVQINAAYREERKQLNDFSNRCTQRQNQNGIQSMQGHQKKQRKDHR